MFAEERKEQIISFMHRRKRATIHELIDTFQVSGATIRADLRELEGAGFIQRTHGGAIYREDMLSDQDGIDSRSSFEMEKAGIARAAARLIHDGETIILDAGTTNVCLAKLIKEKKNLTVVTNDILIAAELYQCPNITIIFSGGVMRPMYGCTAGTGTIAFIQGLSVDKAFISPNALSISRGAFTPNPELADTKKAFLSVADKCYLLCTSNKIGKKALCRFGMIEDFDCIITDAGIREHDKEALEQTGVLVEICDK